MVTTIYDHKTGLRLCFLQNAFDIEYSLNLNGLHTARFSLPAEDVKNAYCTPFNYVELFDGDARVELFRIMPYTFTRTADTHAYTYECEHVLAVLMDDVKATDVAAAADPAKLADGIVLKKGKKSYVRVIGG